MQKLNVVFMGTPDFALPSLSALYQHHNVVAVFCQPDKANARGNKVIYGPVKEFALNNNIPVYQPDTFKNESCKPIIEELSPDIIVVAAYGKILPEYVLNYPKYGCINVHGSLLPKYRGASPIQASVLNGDSVTGNTIMFMSKGLDTGDIILQHELEIGQYETAGELFDRMSVHGAECLIEAIDKIIDGTATRTPQNESESSHVGFISKEMGKLDFSLSAFEIKCKVYGLNPWPSAYIENENSFYKIHKVVMGNKTNKPCGTVIGVSKLGIEVACGDNNSIIITEIQKQGKRKMDAYSFTLGHTISEGQSIYSL